MTYRIEYSKHILKSIEKIPKKDKLAIFEKIEALAINPRPEGVKSLKGTLAGYHRIRVGNYRVIYHIEDKKLIILVVKIAQRGEVYDK